MQPAQEVERQISTPLYVKQIEVSRLFIEGKDVPVLN
jgi:hypothetical protein